MKAKKNLLPGYVFAALLFLLFPGVPAGARETVFPQYGFYMDIPEGFFLAEQNGAERYRFQNAVFPAEFQIAVYPAAQFPGAEEALTHITSQIGSHEPQSAFTWRHRQAALAKLDFPLGTGWAAAAELPMDRGWLTVAAYSYRESADDERLRAAEFFHLSVLDSISTDSSYLVPGMVTSFCFPSEGETQTAFVSADRRIPVPLDQTDAEAAQYLTDREFNLLVLYTDTPLVTDAWKRYYRMVYRDAWKRLEKAAFVLQNRLPKDRGAFTEELVQWLFGFNYERHFEGSDFISLPEAFAQRRGDCDTRSLLLIALLKQAGVDSALLISPEFSHSVAAVAVGREGFSCAIDGKPYAVVDLTAAKTNGALPEEMRDMSKWFAVTFLPELAAQEE